MSEMRSQVIGAYDCVEDYPDTSVFVVARFDKLSEKDFDAYVLDHAKLVVADAESSKIVWRFRDKDGAVRVLVRTSRPRGLEPMDHFAFTKIEGDGHTLVYVHSMGEAGTHKIQPTLEKLRAQLTRR
jgi:hypothetical protein